MGVFDLLNVITSKLEFTSTSNGELCKLITLPVAEKIYSFIFNK